MALGSAGSHYDPLGRAGFEKLSRFFGAALYLPVSAQFPREALRFTRESRFTLFLELL
ncbi:hypothetical protein X740_19580 [Mesorhizobium sp. LNHC221B00]|nr:hypothetical protein X740_19580 [Mesorhizobium sp. LNHC221B00]